MTTPRMRAPFSCPGIERAEAAAKTLLECLDAVRRDNGAIRAEAKKILAENLRMKKKIKELETDSDKP